MMISVRGLSKSVNGRAILKNVCLEVGEGEALALVGPNGAGKTTLLRIINMLDTCYEGEVLINGINVREGGTMLRRSMAMVFQKPVVFSMNVYDNVAYGLRLRKVPRAEMDERVKEVLALLDMSGREREPARHLSGGEAQRVAFARAYVLKPKLLLLDEPTANLDRNNVAIIEKAIRNINERYGTTVVMVTHSLQQARRLARRMAFMMDGELVEAGSIQKMLDDPADARTRAFVSGDMVF
ncbi:ABC-type phosphate transport system, ATPase component [Methanocella conradii HZ254]|uniref:Molybdate/tungstate import ATP-binding protein WtpC n=1 Tax=Methanocella conradii (strain DSM 24694 / JCM 17849 / CGMCC 1.5162 / HZ254) TaxID=1041930 RepID=H8I8D3_METCZ|nr:phosphate ABC transporter ATP-binding protein [Methanocella conradii]AFC98986.1 ABC-type phosphate transport system, ATPase component [Methanocella conradii HZ254]